MHLTFCWRLALPYTFNVKETFLWPRISESDLTSNSGISIALTAKVCRISWNFTWCNPFLFRKREKNWRYVLGSVGLLLQQPPTISYGLRGNRSPYSLESPPPAAHISFKPEMVGHQYGWVKIISAEKRWNKKMNRCYVLTECVGCGSVQWTILGNLTSGKSKGCQHCSQPRQIPLWLNRRLTAAKQRCENSNDAGYHNYGARGIQFDFTSVTAAGLYLIQTFGLPEREMEIDRIDNNGNYAPGNIHFVTHMIFIMSTK